MLTFPRVVLSAATALLCAACSAGDPKSPGIDLGAPDVAWSEKDREQRMGFMAARFHPKMQAIFKEYDDSFDGFRCQGCHGEDMDLVDYKMPGDIYALPTENTLAESRDYDEEVTEFMVKEVMPATEALFNQGAGAPTKVTCFTCHPKEE